MGPSDSYCLMTLLGTLATELTYKQTFGNDTPQHAAARVCAYHGQLDTIFRDLMWWCAAVAFCSCSPDVREVKVPCSFRCLSLRVDVVKCVRTVHLFRRDGCYVICVFIYCFFCLYQGQWPLVFLIKKLYAFPWLHFFSFIFFFLSFRRIGVLPGDGDGCFLLIFPSLLNFFWRDYNHKATYMILIISYVRKIHFSRKPTWNLEI